MRADFGHVFEYFRQRRLLDETPIWFQGIVAAMLISLLLLSAGLFIWVIVEQAIRY